MRWADPVLAGLRAAAYGDGFDATMQLRTASWAGDRTPTDYPDDTLNDMTIRRVRFTLRERSGTLHIMRRLPSHLPQPAADLILWAEASQAAPLAADRVPGAQRSERSHLAALGALGRELATSSIDAWPEPLVAWARDVEAPIDPALVEAVRNSLSTDECDVLAIAYEYLVSGKNRRQLGTFFTPPAIVDYMVDEAKRIITQAPRQVIDPGAGVGAFTLAALSTWRKAEVRAVDINIVTLGLLAARIAARSRSEDLDRLVLEPTDYLAWLQEESSTRSEPRLILGNPPYTRNQHMNAKEKKAARLAAGELITSGLAGLSAYFLAATLRLIRSNDTVCFLLPASWCEARYGQEIRAWLWAARNRRIEIHFFPSEVEAFPGTQVTAMVLVVGPTRRDLQPFVIKELRLVGNVINVTKETLAGRDTSCPPTFTSFLRLPQRRGRQSTIALGDAVTIRRGVATGASKFFFLTDTQRKDNKLPSSALRRALVKPGHHRGDRLTLRDHDLLGEADLPRWLLDLNNAEFAESDVNIQKYLALGKLEGAHSSHLATVRKFWYVVEEVSAPDMFLVPVGKPYHRVIINEVKAVGSNNLYGLTLRDDAPWTVGNLARWLCTDEGRDNLAYIARRYQGGSLKIEPKALRSVQVPTALDYLAADQ